MIYYMNIQGFVPILKTCNRIHSLTFTNLILNLIWESKIIFSNLRLGCLTSNFGHYQGNSIMKLMLIILILKLLTRRSIQFNLTWPIQTCGLTPVRSPLLNIQSDTKSAHNSRCHKRESLCYTKTPRQLVKW